VNLTIVALAGVALWLFAAAILVVSLVGTRKPRGPQSALGLKLAKFWRGTGRSVKERRRHQATLIFAVVVGVIAWLFTGMPIIGLLTVVAIPGAPWLFNVGKPEHDAIARIEAVGEWSRRLKDVSVVGMGLQQAIVASAGTAPAEIVEEVRDLAVRLQAGVDARIALGMFADDISDAVCDQVVAALTLHLSDRGDRLGDVLTSISGAAAAEVGTRREVDAKRTQSRFAVKFLTIATLLVLGYGVIRPSYMAPYATPVGQLIMVVLAVCFVGILLWVRSMSKPEVQARFLSPTVVDLSTRAEGMS
jgi:Flp pilus assembly protein TadB